MKALKNVLYFIILGGFIWAYSKACLFWITIQRLNASSAYPGDITNEQKNLYFIFFTLLLLFLLIFIFVLYYRRNVKKIKNFPLIYRLYIPILICIVIVIGFAFVLYTELFVN